MAWYQSQATKRQNGLPSMNLSRLHAYKDGKVVQQCGMQASSHYTECTLIAVSMMWVRTLQYWASIHYSAVQYTSCLIRGTHEVNFPRSDSRCQWYVSNLKSSTPRYVGIWVKDRHFPSSVMLSLQPASLLFRFEGS